MMPLAPGPPNRNPSPPASPGPSPAISAAATLALGRLHLFLGPCSLLTGVISAPGPSFPFLTQQPGSLSQTRSRPHHSAESLPMASCHLEKKNKTKNSLRQAPAASRSSIPKTCSRLCLLVPGTPSSPRLPAVLCSSLCFLHLPLCRLPLILLPQLHCHLFRGAFPDCTMLSLLFTSSCLFMSWCRLHLLTIF